jgi:hypothetical protein
MDDLNFYRSQGFAVFRKVYSYELIEKLRSDVIKLFSRYIPNLSYQNFDEELFKLYESDFSKYHGAAKAANHLPSFHSLQTNKKILDILCTLKISPLISARALMWFHHKKLAKQINYAKLPPHQELSNMQGSASGAVVWSTLRDMEDKHGFLQVIPRSHLGGLLDITNRNGYDYEIASPICNSEFVEVKVNPTDIIIFNTLTIHKSGDNVSDKIRWTFNFRYNNSDDPDFIEDNYFDPFQLIDPKKIINPRYMK